MNVLTVENGIKMLLLAGTPEEIKKLKALLEWYKENLELSAGRAVYIALLNS